MNKKLTATILIVFTVVASFAQVSKTVNITAGGLSTALTNTEKNTVTSLTVAGTIDAQDFRIMRDSMAVLANIDIREVDIVEYTGLAGTGSTTQITMYPGNTVPDRAFVNNNTVVTIALPSTATEIGSEAFNDCHNLENVTLPVSLTHIGNASFNRCIKLSTLEIPNSVRSIGYYAFGECSSLSLLEIPIGVQTIYSGAFYSCSNLSDIYVEWDVPIDITNQYGYTQTNVFNGVSLTTCTLHVPFGTKNLYQTTEKWMDFQNIVEMEYTYSMPINISAGGLAVAIPSSVRDTITYLAITGTIDARDFKTMRDSMAVLSFIDLSAVNIAAYAGTEGTSINGNINYPANSVPEYAFINQENIGKLTLRTIELPLTTTEISQYAFCECSELNSISIPSSVLAIRQYALGWCSSLSTITLPSGLQYIGYRALSTTAIASIYIPANVNYIGLGALYQCEYLTEINVSSLNENYCSIDGVLFNNEHTELIQYPIRKQDTEYSIPSGVNLILDSSFDGNSFLTKITISEGVTEVKFFAFVNNSNLHEVYIPSSISTIRSNSFYDQNIITITIAKQNPDNINLEPDAFEEVDKTTCTLYVPFGSKTAYEAASQWQDFANIVEMDPPNYTMPLNISAGNLSQALPPSVRDTMTYLALTGTIDARDFKTMRDEMPTLEVLDLSGATIVDYTGTQGTMGQQVRTYPAEAIPGYAFIDPETEGGQSNIKLTNVSLPASLMYIGDAAFAVCKDLESITIPPLVTSIGYMAFAGCNAPINVDTANTNYSTYEGVLFDKNQTTLIQCPTSKTGSYTIPAKVTAIGDYAFYNCTAITSYKVFSTVPIDLSSSEGVFLEVDLSTCTLYVPNGSKTAYEAASKWQNFTNIIEESAPYEMPLNVNAGGLAALLPQSVRDTITYLALTGTIDARDFKTMRDSMGVLEVIDLSEVNIVAYSGTEGTYSINYSYPADEIPVNALPRKNNIKSITLPSSIISIGNNAFQDCNSIVSITIPTSVKSIQAGAFSSCDRLISIEIPSSVESIGSGAFDNCPLPSIYLHAGLLEIGEGAFRGIPGLITVDDSNPNYSSKDGILFNKNQTALLQATRAIIGNYTIPTTVISIGNGAFMSGPISSITIPSSVNYIGENAFAWCYSLKNIIINVVSPIVLSNSVNNLVFYNVDKSTCNLIVPTGSSELYAVADQWKDFINISEIITTIAGGLDAHIPVENRSTLTSLVVKGTLDARDFKFIRDSLPVLSMLDIKETTIAAYYGSEGTLGSNNQLYQGNTVPANAFYYTASGTGKSSITTLSLPSSIITIEERAFQECTGLTSLIIPNLVSFMGNYSFAGCSGLTSISLPSSLISIGNYAFFYCNSLNSITLPLTINTLGSGAFMGCKNLLSINLPNSISSIGNGCFSSCQSLSEIQIPNSITTLDQTFEGCSKLNIVILPNSLLEINNSAFSNCTDLQSIDLPESLLLVGYGAFSTTGISNLVIPKNVATIEYSAFDNCTKLTTISVDANNQTYSSLDGVLFNKAKSKLIRYPQGNNTSDYTIPNGVDTIGNYAFRNCSLLSLILPEGLNYMGQGVFWECSSLANINLPNSITALPVQAFYKCSSLTETNLTDSIKTIGSFAFYNCTSLDTILIPKNATKIENSAFDGCSLLTTAIFKGNAPATFGTDVFKNVKSGFKIQYKSSSTDFTTPTWKGYPCFPVNEYTPIANAGPDQTINEGNEVTLDGTASSDQDSNPITYLWSAPAGITLSDSTAAQPTFTAPDVDEDTDFIFTLVVNDGSVDSNPDTVVITVLPILQNPHFSPVWTGNGVDHMNINVVLAQLDQFDLDAGDEIGIFDGLKCVGASRITSPVSNSNILSIVVSRNDGLMEGYTNGNNISYNIYKRSRNKEYIPVSASYSDINPAWSVDGKFAIGATAFVSLTAVSTITQQITLASGWNIFSVNVRPDDTNLKNILQPLINNNQLKKVMDETGKIIEDWASFGGWQNTIGNVAPTEGYKINVTAACTLSVEGTAETLPLNVSLNAGWNIIGYPDQSEQDGKIVVKALIDAGKLIKVMDETGHSIEDWGAFGGWQNDIGNFKPGKGYKVNVSSACSLTMEESTLKSIWLDKLVQPTQYFTPCYLGNGFNHMNINFVNINNFEISAGDEIGVYDGDMCVGASVVTEQNMLENRVSVASSCVDGTAYTVNGFTPGNIISIKLAHRGKSIETELSVDIHFEQNASTFIDLSSINSIQNGNGPEPTFDFDCYPNPFSDHLVIDIKNINSETLNIAIFDISGRKVKQLHIGTSAGNQRFIWNRENQFGLRVSPGIYFCNINGVVKKIISIN